MLHTVTQHTYNTHTYTPQEMLKLTKKQKEIVDCFLSDYSYDDIRREFAFSTCGFYKAIVRIRRVLGIPPYVRLNREVTTIYLLRFYISCIIDLEDELVMSATEKIKNQK